MFRHYLRFIPLSSSSQYNAWSFGLQTSVQRNQFVHLLTFFTYLNQYLKAISDLVCYVFNLHSNIVKNMKSDFETETKLLELSQ